MGEVIEKKRPWQSKTLWLSLITAGAALYPPAAGWIASNPTIFSFIMGGIFAGLRIITKDGISIT